MTSAVSTPPSVADATAGAVSGKSVAARLRFRRWQERLLRPGAPPSAVLGVLVAAAFLIGETVAVVLLKQVAPSERMGTVYLLGVVVVSAIWRLRFAVIMSIASAITFDYIRDWPQSHALSVELQNGIAHASFLVVALVASWLAAVARARTDEVEARRREAAALAEQQAGLRRIATLVALGVPPTRVFAAVVDEMARCLHADGAVLLRHEPGNEVSVVAASGDVGAGHEPGDHFSMRDGMSPAEELGFAGVDSPILVEGRVWGSVVVRVALAEAAPVKDFADLVATAIANAHTREELKASRARIVAAADTARRRLERDLHDGAQQRLASLRLRLGMLTATVPADLPELSHQLAELNTGLTGVTEDLQEFSRGVHPAILSSGLRPALRTLARRSVLPVAIDVNVDGRLDESVEVAAYYVLAEALTNAAKHSGASQVRVSVSQDQHHLNMTISDDGAGGANPRKGSGLTGLTDRVEALGGQLRFTSPVGRGTSLDVSIPLAN